MSFEDLTSIIVLQILASAALKSIKSGDELFKNIL